jgi:hypothetical protein
MRDIKADMGAVFPDFTCEAARTGQETTWV